MYKITSYKIVLIIIILLLGYDTYSQPTSVRVSVWDINNCQIKDAIVTFHTNDSTKYKAVYNPSKGYYFYESDSIDFSVINITVKHSVYKDQSRKVVSNNEKEFVNAGFWLGYNSDKYFYAAKNVLKPIKYYPDYIGIDNHCSVDSIKNNDFYELLDEYKIEHFTDYTIYKINQGTNSSNLRKKINNCDCVTGVGVIAYVYEPNSSDNCNVQYIIINNKLSIVFKKGIDEDRKMQILKELDLVLEYKSRYGFYDVYPKQDVGYGIYDIANKLYEYTEITSVQISYSFPEHPD